MAWRRQGDKPLSEPMIVIYWRIYASLGLKELTGVKLYEHFLCFKQDTSPGNCPFPINFDPAMDK